MSLPNYLANIKSAGIYRFVWDKSQMSPQQAETLRLVVGYSEKGPFNTPVYVNNVTEFIKIYGNISKKLEKRGVFFHRLALQALQAGPILALNLKKFLYEEANDVKYDQVTYMTGNFIGGGYVDGAVDTATLMLDKDQSKIENVFDTTRFWTLDPDSLQQKELTPAQKLSTNRYMIVTSTDSKETSCTWICRGYAPRGYDVTIKTWYTNAGIEMPDYFEGYEDMLVSDFFAEIYVFRGKFDAAIASTEELKRYFNVDGSDVTLNLEVKDAFGNLVDTLDTLAADANSSFIQKYQGVTIPYFKDLNGAYLSLDLLFNGDNDVHKMLMKMDETMLYDNVITPLDIATRGWDRMSQDGSFQIRIGTSLITRDDVPYETYVLNDDSDDAEFINTQYKPASISDQTSTESYFALHEPVLSYYCVTTDIISTADNMLTIASPAYLDLGWQEGDRFLARDGEKDVKVVTLSKLQTNYDDNNNPISVSLGFANVDIESDIIFDEDEKKWLIKCNHTMGDLISNVNVSDLYFEGYTLSPSIVKPASSKQGDKLNWQNEILSVVQESGMFEALTNNTDVEYRLLVDTFESFVDTELKSTLSYLTRKKDNSFGILNAPAVSTYINCEYTSFTDAEGFKMKYVVEGGNKRKPIGRLFTLPSESNGASWVGFYTPVAITDGTVKTNVPSAALVSNLFMEKYNMRHAYDIVAGPNYGRIIATGLVGPDFNYSRADLDLLEPFGINCMVYVPRRGTQINSNKTAKQTPVSALSSINVRELVIYLQDEIADLLQSYQWELNTQTLRDTVKAKADTILENVQGNGGVIAFKNTCDESNNTPDVIDNEMLVLSTEIEPGRGAGKMVEEITIYRTGGMSSSAT